CSWLLNCPSTLDLVTPKIARHDIGNLSALHGVCFRPIFILGASLHKSASLTISTPNMARNPIQNARYFYPEIRNSSCTKESKQDKQHDTTRPVHKILILILILMLTRMA
ncbi:unnamed protein product, partial [Ectocarpus sp. 12 AP-2014]